MVDMKRNLQTVSLFLQLVRCKYWLRLGQRPSVCLTKPSLFMKPTKNPPRPLCSPGMNLLQYIIPERNAERGRSLKRREWNTRPRVGGSAAYLLWDIQLPSSFLSNRLHWLICFHVESECLRTVSTFLLRSNGYSSAQIIKGCLHYTLWGGKHFLHTVLCVG